MIFLKNNFLFPDNKLLIAFYVQSQISTEELRIESACQHRIVNHAGTSLKFRIQFILNNPIRESSRRYPPWQRETFALSWTKCRYSLSCLLLRLTLWLERGNHIVYSTRNEHPHIPNVTSRAREYIFSLKTKQQNMYIHAHI